MFTARYFETLLFYSFSTDSRGKLSVMLCDGHSLTPVLKIQTALFRRHRSADV